MFSRTNLTICSLLILSSCTANQSMAEQLVGLVELTTGSQSLYSFSSDSPASGSLAAVAGLRTGEQLTSIDYRPLTGELYGLSSGNAIYTLDSTSGTATLVGAGFTDSLNGGNFGFDFNPAIDRIRIVSDADQNFVAHPDTGEANVANTTAVAYASGDINAGAQPNVVHHGYDGNVFGALASGTQLRAIDTNLDILVTQANNAGTLETIGPLGIDALDIGGFDVATTGNAFGVFSDGIGSVTSTLYSIDLNTGAAASLGTVPHTVWGIAAVPVPEPSSNVIMIGLLISLFVVRRR